MINIAAFDFDRTITRGDTFLQFAKFARGGLFYYFSLLLLLPVIGLWKMGVIENWRTKQIAFSWFFRKTSIERFDSWGREMASKIAVRPLAAQAIAAHMAAGDRVVIISASIENWIAPWAQSVGISTVLATKIEVIDGVITGRFLTQNCHGAQKVARLCEALPDIAANRSTYHITAYGDSAGDAALLKFADIGHLNKF